jgi:hypothetical protein
MNCIRRELASVFPWCYKYITLYRVFERFRVENMHQIRESWVWSYETTGRNLIIVRVLHSDPRVIVT